MKPELRRKALSRLAESGGKDVLASLKEEAEKIRDTLSSETMYEVLKDNLELLNSFSYRVHNLSTDIILSFIGRLRDLELDYPDQPLISKAEMKEYQNVETLTVEAIGSLIKLRYLETARFLKALLELSLHDSKSVRDKAVEGLEALAKYNLKVFYGTDEQEGIGPEIQMQLAEQLSVLKEKDLSNYFSAVVTLSRCLLSPTMESTSGTYNTVTWTKGAVQAISGVQKVREGAISLLKRMYALAGSIAEKLAVLSALGAATHTHHAGDFDDDVRDMIVGNTVDVLGFFEALIETEDLPIVQKIEQKSYWRYYHALSKQVESAARAVEGAISKHAEYQIYRDLIGYEGIFGDWSQLKTSENRWEGVDEYRKERASKYALSITQDNYEEWRQRIVVYAKTESNDLATFPNFYQFLREFAAARPELAFELVTTDNEQIQGFLIPLLRGLWASGNSANVRQLIDSWIGQNRYLMQCTKMFLENEDLDLHVLASILAKAEDVKDLDVLRMIVSVAISNYSPDKETLIQHFFLPAIRSLTTYGDAQWVFDSWFRRELKAVTRDMDKAGIELILENLLFLREVDYHAEEILSGIAGRYPERVIAFFGQRLRAKTEKKSAAGSRTFDAIPYELHKLNEPLSKIPEEAVGIVREWFDGDYGMFIYGGAKFLKTIFPDFPEAFESELLKLVKSDDEDCLLFVLSVLRNYEGSLRIHRVCREIIACLPDDSSLLGEVEAALESTGVVMGEFGLAEAYEERARQVSGWLTDPDIKVRAFAGKYIENLEKWSAAERVRAQEQIELRKYRYGE